MLQVQLDDDSLHFLDARGIALTVHFHRTLRIPDDGKQYPLPPGLGHFPMRRVADYADRVPRSWPKTSGVFLPMYQREALWISFSNPRQHRPVAVKVGTGRINAVSGQPWSVPLTGPRGDQPPDYFTTPPQPWLDGFNTAEGAVRQFVAVPMGMGYTMEAQVTGREEHGGIQILAFESKPRRFPWTLPTLYGDYRFGPSLLDEAPPSMATRVLERLRAAGRLRGDPAGLNTLQELVNYDVVLEEDVARVLAMDLGVDFLPDPEGEEPPQHLLERLPSEQAHQFLALPLREESGRLVVALGDPTNEEALACLRECFDLPLEGVLAPPERLKKAIMGRFPGYEALCYESGQDFCFGSPGAADMGLGAGGSITQSIYPDEHGLDTWDDENRGEVHVHLVSTLRWMEITGEEPPPTPISAEFYAHQGLPWFELYDERYGDVKPSDVLARARSIRQLDRHHGIVSPDPSVAVNPRSVLPVREH